MDWSRQSGFLEKMLAPLPSQPAAAVRLTGDAIGVHLNLLLNTRRGSVPHLRHPDSPRQAPKTGGLRTGDSVRDDEPRSDYGMPDIGSFYSSYPASKERLRQEIEALIRRYEPRLEKLRVFDPRFDEREFRVTLQIEGEIVNDGFVDRVRYETVIDRDGQVRLLKPDG